MPMYDFKCTLCGHEEEDIKPYGTTKIVCSKCDGKSERHFVNCATTLTTIIPSYPGCLKKKAGYVHSHGDKDRTKVQGRGSSFSD